MNNTKPRELDALLLRATLAAIASECETAIAVGKDCGADYFRALVKAIAGTIRHELADN